VDYYDSSKYYNDYNNLLGDAIRKLNSGNYNYSIQLLLQAKISYEKNSGSFSNTHINNRQGNPFPDYYIGLNHVYLNNSDSALYYFKKALSESPLFIDSYNEIGNIYLNKMMLDSAKGYYLQGLKFKPDSEWLNHNLGLVYFREIKLLKVKKYFLMNVGVNPDFGPSYILAASIYEENENFHMARVLYSKGVAVSDFQTEYLLARAYFFKRREEFEKARKDFEKIYNVNRENDLVLWQLFLIELKSENFIKGMSYLRSFINMNPDFISSLKDRTLEYRDAEISSLLNCFLKNQLQL
jgi:tetratricopeptide (TPR) repeat protein